MSPLRQETIVVLLLLATAVRVSASAGGSMRNSSSTGGVTMSGTAPPPSCRAGAAKLEMVELARSDTPVVIGKAPDNAGDGLTFANRVMDATNKTQVGTDQGYCSRTIVGHAYHCHFTVTMPDTSGSVHQLMVMGPFFDKPDAAGNLGVMAVVGGTGQFSTSRGEMTLLPRPQALPLVEYIFPFCLEP